jgi:hypothetical protein
MVVTATAHGTERDVMSQQKSTPVPAPDEVGRLYDRLALSAAATFGNNLHFGYWDDPDGDVPFSEAADREATSLMSVVGSADLVCDSPEIPVLE